MTVKVATAILTTLFVSTVHGFDGNCFKHFVEVQSLHDGVTANLIKFISDEGKVTLSYVGAGYPNSASSRKYEIYKGLIDYGNGQVTTVDARIVFKNQRHSGTQKPIWKDFKELLLRGFTKDVEPGQEIKLRFSDISYPSQFSSPVQYRNYVGFIKYENGYVVEVRARLVYRNMQRNGLAKPKWRSTGEMEILAFPEERGETQ